MLPYFWVFPLESARVVVCKQNCGGKTAAQGEFRKQTIIFEIQYNTINSDGIDYGFSFQKEGFI